MRRPRSEAIARTLSILDAAVLEGENVVFALFKGVDIVTDAEAS
jgi:hypothetical protein